MRDSVIGLGALVLALASLLLKAATRIILVLFVVWLIGMLWPHVARSLGLPYTTVYQTVMDIIGKAPQNNDPLAPTGVHVVEGVDGYSLDWYPSNVAVEYMVNINGKQLIVGIDKDTYYQPLGQLDSNAVYHLSVAAVAQDGSIYWSQEVTLVHPEVPVLEDAP